MAAFVQSDAVAGAASTPTNTLTATWPDATAEGSVLILVVTLHSNDAITVPAGWTLASVEFGLGGCQMGVWYKLNAVSESGGVACSWATNTLAAVAISEYSGMGASVAVDTQWHQAGQVGVYVGTELLDEPDELWILALGFNNGSALNVDTNMHDMTLRATAQHTAPSQGHTVSLYDLMPTDDYGPAHGHAYSGTSAVSACAKVICFKKTGGTAPDIGTSGAGASLTQSAVGAMSGAETATPNATWTAPTAAGAFLVAVVAIREGGADVGVTAVPAGWGYITDIRQPQGGVDGLGVGGWHMYLYTIPVAAVSSGTHTWTISVAREWRVTLMEYAGVEGGLDVFSTDAHEAQTVSGQQDAVAHAGPVMATEPAALWLGIIASGGGGAPAGPSEGFALAVDNGPLHIYSKVVSAEGLAVTTIVQSAGSGPPRFASIMACFGPFTLPPGWPRKPPRTAGRIRHVVEGPQGAVPFERMENWSASETAPPGFVKAGGRIPAGLVEAHPEVFVDNAIYRALLDEDEEVVFGGKVVGQPTPADGVVDLDVDGWGRESEREVDRFLAQDRRYSAWVELPAPPLKYPSSELIQHTVEEGALLWLCPKGTQFKGAGPWRGRLAYWADEQPLHRVALTLESSRALDPTVWQFEVLSADGPSGTAVEVPGSPVTLTGGEQSLEFEFPANDVIMLNLKRLRAGAQSPAVKVEATDVRVNGYAVDDLYLFSDLVADVFGLMGVDLMAVDDIGGNLLPYDLEGGTLADPLDYAALMTDGIWGIFDHGRGPAGRAGAWGQRTWLVPDPEIPFRPAVAPRYDRVTFRFKHPNKAVGLATVKSSLGELPEPRAFFLTFSDPLPDEDDGRAMALVIADYLFVPRQVGEVSFSVVEDVAGVRVSGHKVHVTDLLYVPGHDRAFRVGEIRRRARVIDCVFDDGMRVVERYLARREQQMARTGRFG